MIKRIISRLSLLIIFVAVINRAAIAQFEEGKEIIIVTPLAGAAIVPGATNTLTYVKSTGETSRSIKNIVTFKINEQSTTYFKTAFTAKAYLKIEYWATSIPLSAVQTQYKSLTVNFDPSTGAKYDVRAYLLLDISEQVKITVDTISIIGYTGWDPKPTLQLENEMRILQYYTLSNNTTYLTPTFGLSVNNTDAVGVSWTWNAATNNNSSQLEWAWISDEMASNYANTDLLFQNNSTRIDLDPGQNTYEIPLLYGDTGKLYYRVRAALRKNDGSVITGPWSLAQKYPSTGSFAGHQTNLNWQSSTSFAENGKFKTVIQYFDGTLRSRQTVTKDNSTGNTVVAETIYDLQGRPNIQILPAPTIDNTIQYFKDFNRFLGQKQVIPPGQQLQYEDPAKYFDLSIDAIKCNGSPKLDSTSGAGKYYSTQNSWLATEEKSKYIPYAEGYAYTETRYMNDPAQRISRRGGVGQIFQVDNGHDTKYFYGKPSQQELDALFGTEVGDASHYSKNMVQDANGQMSISYVDMHGRTIATALAGDSTINLQAIYTNTAYYPSNSDALLTNQLLTPANNIINGASVESISTILAPTNTSYNFTYKLDPATLNLLNCNNLQVCFDCKYNLEISIRPEDCSNTTPIVKRYNNLQIAACGSSMGFVGEGITTAVKQIDFTQSLAAGSWIVRKTLTINDSLYAIRKDSAQKAFLCQTEKNIYDSVYNMLIGATACQATNYKTTRPCDSCNANLGTFTNYRTKYLTAIALAGTITAYDADIHTQYSQDSLACADACNAISHNLSALKMLRDQLLNDMVPYTGQYAIPKDSVKNPVTGLFDPKRLEARYNIFTNTYTTSSGLVTLKPYYFRYPKNEVGQVSDYFTEDDHIDLSIEPKGTSNDRTILDAGITSDFYTNLSQRSWAKSLIYYHPEFSKLKFAETNLVNSYAFLDSIQACTTYATAISKGYIMPLTSDPYFVNNYVPTDKTNMTRYLTLTLGAIGDNTIPSIWQIANGNVGCAVKTAYDKQTCISNSKKNGIDPALNSDSVWEQFKSLYLSYRNEMIVGYINSQPGVLSQAGMDSLQNENKQLNFAKAQDVADQNGWTWWTRQATSGNVDTAALRLTALNNLSQTINTDNCIGQKPFWKARLVQCEQLQKWLNRNTHTDSAAVNNIVNTILDSMVMVCQNSANGQQPYGYSKVNPAYSGVPKSFEDIINHVFKQNGITSVADSNYFCNPFTIDFPKTIGKNPPILINNTNIIDTCGCKRFASLKLEAKAAGFDTLNLIGATGMNRFFITKYNDSLTTVIWQGLQKCNNSFFKDTCFNVISGPGYAYSEGSQFNLQMQQQQLVQSTCPVPTISSTSWLNTTTSVNNIQINYATTTTYTACFVDILDSLGHVINELSTPCGLGHSKVLSLPKCTKYKFRVYGNGLDCIDIASSTVTLTPLCTACPPATAINGAIYLNTGSSNNVQLNYTSNASATNCKVVITNYVTGAKTTQTITGGSSLVTLSLAGCQAYLFQIYSGVTGNCYDSSNVYYLPACTNKCQHVYTPVYLQNYVIMPAFLSCDYQKPCISCNTLNTLVTEFKTIYPAYAVPYTDTVTTTVKQLKQNSLLARFLNYRTGFSKNANEYISVIKGCTGGGTTDTLCSFAKPVNDISDIYQSDTMPCRAVQTQATFIAQLLYQQRKDSLAANFDSLYKSKCFGAKVAEQFYATYQPKEYHYTLYYFDQAGNLVKTLPPAAVKPNYNATYLAQVNAARIEATDLVNANNNELLATQYRYNSLNQVISQKTPDANISRFWYDMVGRLVISQNAKQMLVNNYSYTLCDALGRISEVGQKPQTTVMTQLISQDIIALKNWMNGTGIKEQITFTRYDEAYPPIAVTTPSGSGLWQRNLRNRVSYTYIKAKDGTDPNYPWDAATFYTYDIHGSVDTLFQDYKTGMGYVNCSGNPSGNRFKKIAYSYDLISGKVNDVVYQPGQSDQYYHHYDYDAENRLIQVKTSKDKIYWERDAVYDYYRHGPLARTELGENRVQGLDYAYTLQGWLKGVNATAISTTTTSTSFDMGRDGVTVALNNNSLVARDAYGFSLNYFTGDYKAINTNVFPFTTVPMTLPAQPVSNITTGAQLYNGNIGAMVVNIPQLGNANIYGYKYDQLNRIVRMDAFNGLSNTNNVLTASRVDSYHEEVTYDPNGNIKTYLRNGDSRSLNMDKLIYNYVANSNQLNQVTDGVTTATPSDYNDIKTQAANNYTYDKIGNLISDKIEGISNIDWSVYGKIKTITKTDGTVIKYAYDAGGNRISKIVATATTGDSTYYVRDAGGNVMSVYNKKGALNLFQKEIHLYGSSRLGVYNVSADVQNCANTTSPITILTRGNKFFELSNHLGNVLATISDEKIGVDSNGDGVVDYYRADVVTASDYYPFGMMMPGRKYSNGGKYAYGFNGKRIDNEIKGDGNSYDYGARMYDPRVVRFLSIDPMTKSYPLLTPYQFVANSPIWGIDVDGLEFMPYLSAWFHIKTDITSYTGTAIPFAVSCFDVTKTSVVIDKANVASVYKDTNGKPLFDAMGIGLTPEGKYDSHNYEEIRSSGLNNLPQNPDWVFAPSPGFIGVRKDLSHSIQGTSTGVFKAGDAAVTPSFNVTSPGSLNTLSSGSGVLQEIEKYGQMFSNLQLNNASIDLVDSKNVFDVVAKIVNKTYAKNDESNFSGFNKGDLVNFVLDGTLPANKGVAATDQELIRNISIMNVGIQIIDNHVGENHIIGSGVILPWDYYSTQVTERTNDTYKATIEEYQQRHTESGQGQLKID